MLAVLEDITELVRLVARGGDAVRRAGSRAARATFGQRLLDVYLRAVDLRSNGEFVVDCLWDVVDAVDRCAPDLGESLFRARDACELQINRVHGLASALRRIREPLTVLDPEAADTLDRWLGPKGEVVYRLVVILGTLAGRSEQDLPFGSKSYFIKDWHAPLIGPYDRERADTLAEGLRSSGLSDQLDELEAVIDRIRGILIANFSLEEILIHTAVRERSRRSTRRDESAGLRRA